MTDRSLSSLPEEFRILYVDEKKADQQPESFDDAFDTRFDFTFEASPETALNRLESTPYDCVVAKTNGDGSDGIELLRSIRSEYSGLPVILVTEQRVEEVASQAIQAGATNYLGTSNIDDWYLQLANQIELAVTAYRSTQELAERTRRLETLTSNLPGIVYRCRNEPDWPMETVEGEFEDITGYLPESLMSGDISWGRDIIHPDDEEETWKCVQEGLSESDGFELTYRIITASGEVRWMWERGRGIYDDADELVALEGFITDITPRKKHQQQLEEQKEKLRKQQETLRENQAELETKTRQLDALLDSVAAAIWMRDTDHRFLLVNQRFRELVQISPETKIEGKSLSAVCPPDLATQFRADDEAVIETEEPIEREETFQTSQGSRTYLIRITPLFDEEGTVYATCGVATDITSQEEAKQRLDVLNRVLRHNLRNSATVIEGYAQVLSDQIDEGDEGLADRIIDHSQQIGRISTKARDIDQLLARDNEIQPIDVVSQIETVIEQIESVHTSAEVSLDLGKTAMVETNPALLDELLWNIIENAIEHSENETPSVQVETTLSASSIVLEIADNGPGIPDLERRAIMAGEETALTHGSGLGLWLAKWGVTRIGGTMEIESPNGGGTMITIELPVAEA